MSPISIKKVLTAIFVIILLSRLDLVLGLIAGIFKAFYDAFEPLRNSPPLAKYTAALMVLALLYITMFKLLQKRR